MTSLPLYEHMKSWCYLPRGLQSFCCPYTVESVYNGPVLSGHPLLSGHFLTGSRFFAHANAVFGTCIRWPPLLSDRGLPVTVLCLSFFVIFTCIKRPPLNGKAICTVPWITGIVAGSADSQRLALQTKNSNSGAKRKCHTCLNR